MRRKRALTMSYQWARFWTPVGMVTTVTTTSHCTGNAPAGFMLKTTMGKKISISTTSFGQSSITNPLIGLDPSFDKIFPYSGGNHLERNMCHHTKGIL